jgi:sec-independent protein translocase protein TatB
MLDIGWQELFIVFAIGLVVIGPKDLPRAVKTVAQYVRKARSLAREFQNGLDDMVREAELDDLKKELTQASPTSISREIENTIDPTGDLRQSIGAVDPTAELREALDASEPATTSTAVAVEPEPDEATAEPPDESATPSATAVDAQPVAKTQAGD